MSLALPRSVWADIGDHAGETYPEECCGVLLGPVPKDFAAAGRLVTVRASRRLKNVYKGHEPERRRTERSRRFEVDPAELAQVEKECAKGDEGIVGWYHSHPDVPSWPSPFDLMRAWPCYSYLILSLSGHQVEGARSWVRTEDAKSFIEEPITFI